MPLCAPHTPSRRSASIASVLLFAVLLVIGGALPAGEREDFLTAEAAFQKGQAAVFERLASELRGYPLYPYLRYASLKRHLGRASSDEIKRFLSDYADTPLAARLRRAWLHRLAKREAWADYVQFYRPDGSTERRCIYLRALLNTERASEALNAVEPLWLVGRSQPAACDPVFAAWQAAGRLTDALLWARIALAIDADQTPLARYLARLLPEGEKVWLQRWLAVHTRPERVLDPTLLPQSHPQRMRIWMHGIERLARHSPDKAADALDLIEACYDVPADVGEQAVATIGLALAEEADPRGLDYLNRIPSRRDNMDLQERRLRAALRLGAWPRIATWVRAMPDGQRKAEHWLYWQARALEVMGEIDAAQRLYTQAARERCLWGFLAAERLDTAYPLDHRPAPVSEERVIAIAEGPAGRRITEFRALNRILDMRREWAYLVSHLEGEDLMAAAVLAKRWDWPDQAIFTLARSGYWDDLELRFPVLYRDAVREGARATGLDDSWIYAILRQESAFNRQAVSGAGALGLMQLMPATARAMAKVLALRGTSRSQLLDAQRNIALGSAYLAQMHQRFEDNPVLAAAAYNAGPAHVDRWLPAQPLDADIWVATIPFRETRDYVRRVLAYRLIYDYRLGRPIAPLSELMRPVGHVEALSGGSNARSKERTEGGS